jgi:CRP/FNR family transcriptional regulator, cyclic AMP receptor protein
MPDAVARKLAASSREMAYSRGDVIARIGERCDPGMVKEGVLRYSIRSEDGRSATLRYVTSGEMFGIESLFKPMSHVVTAISPSRVMHYDRQTLDDLSRKNAPIARWAADQMSELLVRLDNAASALAFMTVAQRVALHLVAMDGFNDGSKPADAVRLNHQQLADAVGSVREVVARVVKELREQRVVETSRQGIRITNRSALYVFGFDYPRTR